MLFRIDDVLQTLYLGKYQKLAFQKKSPFEWFKETVDVLKGQKIKLAIVAEGIGRYPEWDEYIKAHPGKIFYNNEHILIIAIILLQALLLSLFLRLYKEHRPYTKLFLLHLESHNNSNLFVHRLRYELFFL